MTAVLAPHRRSGLETLARRCGALAAAAAILVAGAPAAAADVPGERLQPEDLVYQGAFRLPDDFNWGALGLTFHPQGEGSLLVTGFQSPSDPAHPGEYCWDPSWDCLATYGEVAIPDPVVAASWEDLPEAEPVGPMVAFDDGLVAGLARETTFVSDIVYVPRRGSQSADKVYGAVEAWYAEGEFGESTFPTIWMANLDGSGVQGLFHVGPEESPFHGRKVGAYLFTVPEWYADRYLGGRTVVTGRSRGTPVGYDPVTTAGGSQGPTLFAFHALASDEATGTLDAIPVLYYRVAFPGCAGPNVGDPAQCDYPDFSMCDDWSGGSFVDNGARRAILLFGWKGLGGSCYDLPDPPVVCDDPCSAEHGYHCYPYERQVIFYDVHALGDNVSSETPWTVLPYATWRPAELFLQGHACWDVGGMTFDPASGRLFLVERGLGEGEANAAVVHVWQVAGGGSCTLTCSGSAPASAAVGEAVAFSGAGQATGCSGSPTFDWDFGDGSAHATAEDPTHSYQAAGTFTWRLEVRADSATCSDSGQITISDGPPPAARYLVPGVAHASGLAGSVWRSDLAVVNPSAAAATLTLTFHDHDTGATTTASRTLSAGATEEWVDVMVSTLGFAATDQVKGVLEVASTEALGISCRTYNQETATRTYGQQLPALTGADALPEGAEGIVPHLKRGDAFRTNLGVVNLGDEVATVTVRLFGPSGEQVGADRSLTVAAGRWQQQTDVLSWAGAGDREIAYARLEVEPATARVWAYASLVDNATGDPTTVAVVAP